MVLLSKAPTKAAVPTSNQQANRTSALQQKIQQSVVQKQKRALIKKDAVDDETDSESENASTSDDSSEADTSSEGEEESSSGNSSDSDQDSDVSSGNESDTRNSEDDSDESSQADPVTPRRFREKQPISTLAQKQSPRLNNQGNKNKLDLNNNNIIPAKHRHKHLQSGRKANGEGTKLVALSSGVGDASFDSVKSSRRKRRRRKPVTICLTHCRYEIVRSVSRRHGLAEVNDDIAWNIYWTDYSVSLERALEMKRFQVVNHFPGMNEICRKDLLARNLNRMKRSFPDEYNIYPMTWCLPADNNELQAYSSSRRGKTYICKPEMGCQGRGIFLVKNIKDVNPFGRIICQIYIQKPFLIDHLKFDLRVYVLITSCDPLRIFVFKEGLARFATAKYQLPTQNNTENSYMHLTNYAVNKFSRDFVVDAEAGTKRKLTTVISWLQQRGYDVDKLEEEMDDVIIKTILSAQPTLKHHYKTCFPQHDICSACFEILGFDILLDHKLKPFVIEVNHSPSFHTDSQLDREIKETLLNDTFAILNFRQLDRGKIEREDRRRVQERITSKLNEVKLSIEAKKEGTSNAVNNNKANPINNINNKQGKKPGQKPATINKKPEEVNNAKSPRKVLKKEDYEELQFQHELENCGNYRLIFPTDDTLKYDKFLVHNQVSLYQDTAASQARATLTKAKIDDYNLKKQIEEQKRIGQGTTQISNFNSVPPCVVVFEPPCERHPPKILGNGDESSKLRPESGGPSIKNSEIKIAGGNNKPAIKMMPLPNTLLPCNPSNGTSRGFTLSHIISKEECDRVRGLIQRGLLLRSLGIELQVYQLLCKVGGLKKAEHDEFRRKHGFILPAVEHGSGNGGNLLYGIVNRPASSIVPPKFYMKLNQFSVDSNNANSRNNNNYTNAVNTSAEASSNVTGRPHQKIITNYHLAKEGTPIPQINHGFGGVRNPIKREQRSNATTMTTNHPPHYKF